MVLSSSETSLTAKPKCTFESSGKGIWNSPRRCESFRRNCSRIPYCGAFFGELGAKLLADVILIRQKVKSPKKYSKSQFTERKQNTSLHSLSSLHGLQSAQSAVGSLHFNVTAMTVLSSNCYLMYLFLSHLVVTSIYILQ